MTTSSPHEKAICGAKTRSGKPCRKAPMANGRCRLHGGLSLKGPDSPTWKHGRRSKYNLPDKLQKAYEAALDDPELASMKHELAALDAMLVEMSSNLQSVDRDLLKKLSAGQKAIDAAVKQEDGAAFTAACQSQHQLIADAAGKLQAVFDVANLMEKRSRIASREHRRMVQLDAMVRFDDFILRLGMMMEAVRDHVRDTTAIAAIATTWQRILGPLPRGITESPAAVHDRGGSVIDVGSQPTEADAGDGPDAELRAAFEGAMQRLASGPDERGSGAGGGSGDQPGATG